MYTNNNMKKITILLVLVTLVVARTSAQIYHFTFDNPQETPWTVIRGEAQIVNGGITGNNGVESKALQLNPRTVVTFQLPKLERMSTYHLTAWLRTASGDTHVALSTVDLGAGNFSIASALANWAKVERTFNYPDGKLKNPRIEITFEGESNAWVDEITIERVGDYIPPVINGIPPRKIRTTKTDFGVEQLPNEKLEWLHKDKLGMFIHWGLYSGLGQGEWRQENIGMLPNEYRKLAYPESGEQYFDAKDYDANKWVDLAKAMGARYMVLTTMHHDGFALFESKYMNAFTAKQTLNRDLVKEFVDAARGGGMKVGLYKTLINWRFPGYYDVDGIDCKKNKFGYTTESWHKENARQMKEELYCQTQELLTNYGKIDMLFWDGGWIEQRPSDREGARLWEPYKYLEKDNQWPVNPLFQLKEDGTGKALGLMGMVRQLQPDMLVNPRCGWIGDYVCEEGDFDTKGEIRTEMTEKNMTMTPYWGYSEDCNNPEKHCSVQRMQRIFADCLIRNMNLLINISPDRHGAVPPLTTQVLTDFGKWVAGIKEAVYDTEGGPWEPVDSEYGFTCKGNRIYAYILDGYDGGTTFTFPNVDKGMKAKKAYDVATRKKLKIKQKGQQIILSDVPTTSTMTPVQVICIELNKDVWSAK